MTPTSLAAAVAPRTGKLKKKTKTKRKKRNEKRTFLKRAWNLKS